MATTFYKVEDDYMSIDMEYNSSWLGNDVRVRLDEPSRYSRHVSDAIRDRIDAWLKQNKCHRSDTSISYERTKDCWLEVDDNSFYLYFSIGTRREYLKD